MKKFLVAVLLFSIVFAGIVFAQNDVLTVCTFPMPPYTFRDNAGNLKGLEVDLVNALFKEAGFRAEFKEYPWNRAMALLKEGELDLLMTLSKTPEREEFIHFLGVSTFQQYVLFVRKENIGIGIKTSDDLTKEGYLFGIRQNFHYSDEFNKRLASDENFKKHFEAVAQTDLNLKKVNAGHLTGCFGDSILTGYQIQTDKAFEDIRAIGVPFFQPDPVYFGIRKKISRDKLEKLQKAYDVLDKKGIFEKIIDQWL